MTLGTLNIARGLTSLITNGAPVSGLGPEVRYLGQANYDFGIFPPPAGLPASLFLVDHLRRRPVVLPQPHRSGRHIFAIGGNPQAARVSGINVDRVLVYVYAICGFFAGLAGLAARRAHRFRLSAGRVGMPNSTPSPR